MASSELTELLRRAQEGDGEAADALFAESYRMLTQLARARLRRHVRTPTLDTSSLVHEAYLRFVSAGRLTIADSTGLVVPASGRLVAVIGIDDVVVVDTPDALLVTTRDRAQQVKSVVDRLKSSGRSDLT